MIELNLLEDNKIAPNIIKETIRLKRHCKNDSAYNLWRTEYDAVLDITSKKIVFFDDAKFNLFLIRSN